jgi:hypothetical protein
MTSYLPYTAAVKIKHVGREIFHTTLDIVIERKKKKSRLCSLGFTCLIPRGNKQEFLHTARLKVKGEVPGLNQLSTTP